MRSRQRNGIAVGLAIAMVLSTGATFGELPAFPGAVGQASGTAGGRGGDVYHVTNLRDYNSNADEPKIPGSLRHAVRSAEGPRTIVFDVSGPIALECPLEILKNNLTIAGQTSPGGVTLWGYPLEISQCSDVVIRHLRIRLGDFHARHEDGQQTGFVGGNNDLDASSANAMAIHGDAERILLDHLSVSWGMDETLSVTKCRDVTVQHCLIAESLKRSFHAKGSHGYGSLVRGELTADDQAAGVGGFTFYQNMWAHHDARNPSIAGQQRLDRGQREEDRRRADVNLVNCLVYNWGNQATHRSNDGQVRINLLGNYYANGSAKKAKYFFRGTPTGPTFVRHAGNVHDRTVDGECNGELIDTPDDVAAGFHDMNDDDEIAAADPPFEFIDNLETKVLSADQAVESVKQHVGASLWRDEVDHRVIDSFATGTGRLIDSQEELRVGGVLPGIDDLKMTKRPEDFDTDRDGMPNEWEARHGLDANNPNDQRQTTLSSAGYTNLETYLNDVAQPELE
ncbi:pectate lyase family protein [Aeoliella sp.]|uniref:pectate lyase family protein n=1 Tax=Aeoliella sp. TaxID=2795800 RepID=UPI003CCB85AD